MLYFDTVGGEGITITGFEDGDGGFEVSANPAAFQLAAGQPINLGPPFVPEASTTFEGNSKYKALKIVLVQICMHTREQ